MPKRLERPYKNGDVSRKGFPVVLRSCALCAKEYRAIGAQRQEAKIGCCTRAHLVEYFGSIAARFSCAECGKLKRERPFFIKRYKRKFCSRECKISRVRKEADERRKTYSKHQLDRIARYSPEAEKWRKSVFERDNYTCQACGVRGGYLEADHIKPWAFFKELRFELSNGRTLCRKCHDKTKMSAKKMRETYQNKDQQIRQEMVSASS